MQMGTTCRYFRLSFLVFGGTIYLLYLLSGISAALDPSRHNSDAVQMDIAGGEYTTNSIGMEFRLIQPGSFLMGSNTGKSDEKPVHTVNITKSYFIGVYEVTQKQWIEIMGDNPSKFVDNLRPVEQVNWEEVQQFINKLSQIEGIQYRLPTEAEWEYACRAGTDTQYYWGNKFDEDYAWCLINSGNETQPVGLKKPNFWGLYDMCGNVWEWCEDYYGPYPEGEFSDPKKASGAYRVTRGGSWNRDPDDCRSASRDYFGGFMGRRYSNLGFRLVREAD
jgi:formylglycine-generating enzyme required for sulfatase activity